MTSWVVRAWNEDDEDIALSKSLVSIRWDIEEDLSFVQDRDYIRKLCEKERGFHQAPEGCIRNSASQLYSFVNKIQKNDLIILPLKKNPNIIRIGRADSYEFRYDLKSKDKDKFSLYHTRNVKWYKKELDRCELNKDTLKSINCPLTIYRINSDSERDLKRAMRERGFFDEEKTN